MTPYRTPAPHRCTYDRTRYVPPHHFVDVCACGAEKPLPLWARALDTAITVVLDVILLDDDTRPED